MPYQFKPENESAAKHEKKTWLVIHPKGLVARRGEGDALIFPTEDEARAMGLFADDAVAPHRLGVLDETDAMTVPWADNARRVEAPFELFGLRMLAAFVDAGLFGVLGRAMHACDWLTTTRFCGRCGAKTTRHASERSAVCPQCGLHTYPRISPAIITLVRKGDLALLANNAKFPGAFYSTLAGFADIGESLEETLVREVKEEVGVTLNPASVKYFGSQPWPFPNSLMIAFTAEWQEGEIEIDPTEIADAKWFSVNDLPMMPPPLSIARQMIDAWIDEVNGARSH